MTNPSEDLKLDFKITERIGKGKLESADGIFCECSRKLTSLEDVCVCNDEEKIPSLVTGPKVYNKMMDSAIALLQDIKRKSDTEGEIVTQEEADFVNDFSAYAIELYDKMKEQGL